MNKILLKFYYSTIILSLWLHYECVVAIYAIKLTLQLSPDVTLGNIQPQYYCCWEPSCRIIIETINK